MGGRTMPTECKHGVTIDWGDFGPDPDDGSVGANECDQCRAGREAWADALMDRLIRKAAEGCCMKPGSDYACEYHQGFYDGCDEMWRALQDDEADEDIEDPWGSPIRITELTRQDLDDAITYSERASRLEPTRIPDDEDAE